MESADYNLDLFEAMLDEIEDFLLSADIFWPLAKRSKPESPPYPRLSTGALLMTQDESLAQEAGMNTEQKARHAKLQSQWKMGMNTEQKARHAKLQSQWKMVLNKWRSALGRKSEREMGMRLNLWRAYLSDLEEGKASHFDYDRETRNRVQFTRLRTLTVGSSKTIKMT